jgi:Cytochrome c554 and c-prime
VVFAGIVLWVQNAARADDPAHFVGGEICAACHAAETARWKESHHAQAMQAATPAAVLGDFADARLNHFGVVTTFSRAGDKFMVHTDGPDGALHHEANSGTEFGPDTVCLSIVRVGEPAALPMVNVRGL